NNRVIWKRTSQRRPTFNAKNLIGRTLQQARSASAVNVHTVAATAGALAFWNQPPSPSAKQSQPRSTRVTNLLELLFIGWLAYERRVVHDSISATAASQCIF